MNYNYATKESRAGNSRAVGKARKSPGTYQPTSRSASSSRSTGFAGTRGMRGNAAICSLLILAFWAAFALFLVWGAQKVVGDFLSMPYVHQSHSTGECVAVIAPNGDRLGCENKPNRYHHVWVE